MSGAVSLTIQLSGSQGKTNHYEDALRNLGAVPLPGYCPAPDLSCDGLILCGGGDLDSSLFGQESRGSEPPDPARDQAELELFRAFSQAGKPILGICRGMQLINVALGGSLIQDLSSHVRVFHRGMDQDLVHPVRTLEGSFLHQLYGPLFSVNSFHHQAVDRLGEGLRAIAWSEGGVMEALDCPDRPILGVQFHPERMAFSKRRLDTVDGAPILSHFLTLCRQAHSL
ncbi:gamma-glutamyl-gamma-aminobutyrate hydrolase family protein [Lawsonibacter sp. LCP25S3_G6]|uniref:gamma-glutamyl-gamma-aminobutyrate hydrolase family protein n=1 Tax=unclassified Lawsonibacter TaxID=2617946 RepID=UPI003F9C7B5B